MKTLLYMDIQLVGNHTKPKLYTSTRHRNTDPDTSRAAAKSAASQAASGHRLAILQCLRANPGGMTAKEIAADRGLSYYAVSRRLSECAGISRTGEVRERCAVWIMEGGGA